MAKQRSYNLLCPIARGLDAVGDRWSLLILRDLHAGPARFGDLQTGLHGIASNLLADRLVHLREEGLIEKTDEENGTTSYQLTQAGRDTRHLLFELARFGGRLTPVPEPKKPGNLRTIAVTLAAALDRVIDPDLRAEAQLSVEGEPYAVSISDGRADVRQGENPDAALFLTTSYHALLQVAAGHMSFDDFASQHADIKAPDDTAKAVFLARIKAAMAQMQ